ncbi:hypothetical protein [Nonomuraea sp. NPDC003804]|uniref:zinc finger domain-containing protein n=1 Tax=Nonomuraea sp. NPDC003804 TaxID=3154547 RepID=UPI0033AB2BC0
MTPVEAVKFVQYVSALWPQQRLEDATPDAWYAAGLKDVDAADARDAANKLVVDKVFISLAELLTEVKAIRAGRIALAPVPAPPAELADEPVAYREAFHASLRQMARGFALPKQITSGAEPNEAYTAARGGDRDPLRVEAIRVPCPWPPCRAVVGAGCVDGQGHRLPAPAHEARLRAAGLLEEGASS